MQRGQFRVAEVKLSVGHAGVGTRVTIVVGTLGDSGKIIDAPRTVHRFGADSVDRVFIDHAKEAYLPDLRRILEPNWLRPSPWSWLTTSSYPALPSVGPT